MKKIFLIHVISYAQLNLVYTKWDWLSPIWASKVKFFVPWYLVTCRVTLSVQSRFFAYNFGNCSCFWFFSCTCKTKHEARLNTELEKLWKRGIEGWQNFFEGSDGKKWPVIKVKFFTPWYLFKLLPFCRSWGPAVHPQCSPSHPSMRQFQQSCSCGIYQLFYFPWKSTREIKWKIQTM